MGVSTGDGDVTFGLWRHLLTKTNSGIIYKTEKNANSSQTVTSGLSMPLERL